MGVSTTEGVSGKIPEAVSDEEGVGSGGVSEPSDIPGPDWILDTNFWGDGGIWIDTETWND